MGILTTRRARAHLLTSAAGICLFAMAGTATAAPLDDTSDPGRPDAPQLEAQGGHLTIDTADIDKQIVIAAPGTPTTARDPNNVTGVGQMIIDEQNGFIGLCTGTLINPRTVIFAAHCVNERAATDYGANSGGQPIGFGFGNNNNAAGASAFGGWLGNYQTDPSRHMYNANYVAYNPLTLEPGNTFLYGDVALASLDTPAADVPTWKLLFSALPDPGTITASGTGYHVALNGYGNNGTGITGSTGGIDFRRRVAENMLGGLASLDDFEGFIFGAPSGLPQNLYWIDFDDPRRGTAQASPYDFNAWRDNALPDEGITASGDSGGPLILDQSFAQQVVIGVLSGGYTRFFGAQPANGYGTASFYQPLYLYWDWIAANNPYHYVSAKAGDGKWTDPSHWVSNLDPAYMIIGPDGKLVNAIPDTPGAQNTHQDGFGQACFQAGGISDCLDIASGDETIEAKPIGTAANDKGSATVAALEGQGGDGAVVPDGTQTEAVVSALPAPTLDNGLPGASDFVPNNDDGDRTTATKPRYFDVTLAAAGTTTLDTDVTVDRFTVNGTGARLDITGDGFLTSLIDVTQLNGQINVDGGLLTPGNYTFAGNSLLNIGANGIVVTLGEFNQLNGQVTVSGELGAVGDYSIADNSNLTVNAGGTVLTLGAFNQLGSMVVDNGLIEAEGNYTVAGTAASLSIGSTGSLSTLGAFNQMAGLVAVNGTLDAPGDYTLYTGGLMGSGTINTPWFTNLLGTIAPGTAGTTGTLTFNGNAVLSSGTVLLLDLGPNGTSDKIVVKVSGGTGGQASIGGTVGFAAVAGYKPHAGDVFTVLTADTSLTGTFNNPAAISAILSPKLLYSSKAVQVQIQAGRYLDVVGLAPLQIAYAQLLDQNRPQQDKYAGLYGSLDLASAGVIRATLDSMPVATPTTAQSLAIASIQNMTNFFRDRLGALDPSGLGGDVAMIGNPTQFASLSFGGMPLTSAIASDAATPMVEQGKLPETMSAFFAGGYLTGNADPVAVAPGYSGKDQYDGWFAAAGLEASIGDHALLGFAFSYTELDGDSVVPGQTARGRLYQGTLYGKLGLPGGAALDAQFSAGAFETTTRRTVGFFGSVYNLKAKDRPLALSGELGIGKQFDLTGFELTPRAALRWSNVGFTPTAETGGPMALMYDRGDLNSVQSQVGLKLVATGKVRPWLSGYYVHEFEERPIVFGANFVGGIGPAAIFALNGTDKDWGELAGGLVFKSGSVDIGVAAATTVWRTDVESQTYRGSVTVHF